MTESRGARRVAGRKARRPLGTPRNDGHDPVPRPAGWGSVGTRHDLRATTRAEPAAGLLVVGLRTAGTKSDIDKIPEVDIEEIREGKV